MIFIQNSLKDCKELWKYLLKFNFKTFKNFLFLILIYSIYLSILFLLLLKFCFCLCFQVFLFRFEIYFMLFPQEIRESLYTASCIIGVWVLLNWEKQRDQHTSCKVSFLRILLMYMVIIIIIIITRDANF